jgi:hypothetical protein
LSCINIYNEIVESNLPEFIHGNVTKFLLIITTYFHNFKSHTFPKFLSPNSDANIEKIDNGCKSINNCLIIFNQCINKI